MRNILIVGILALTLIISVGMASAGNGPGDGTGDGTSDGVPNLDCTGYGSVDSVTLGAKGHGPGDGTGDGIPNEDGTGYGPGEC